MNPDNLALLGILSLFLLCASLLFWADAEEPPSYEIEEDETEGLVLTI